MKSGVKFCLLTVLCIYSFIYLLFINGVYITNFNQRTSINIQVRNGGQTIKLAQSSNSGAVKSRDTRKWFLYDHPVLRRVDGKDLFYLSAILDENLKDLTGQYVDAKSRIKHDTDDSDGGREGVDYNLGNPYNGLDLDYYEAGKDQEEFQDLYEDDPKTSPVSTKDGAIIINGWESFRHHDTKYHCCYEYSDKTKSSAKVAKKNIWDLTHLKLINAVQIICPLIQINGKEEDEEIQYPKRIALTSRGHCQVNSEGKKGVKSSQVLRYINVAHKYVPPDPTNSIAICAKLIYDDYPAGKLIEWFEFNRLMGADKIMMFRYNVSEAAAKVLDHYEENGLLVTKEFDYPMKRAFLRKPGGKNIQSFHDEQVSVFDCVERFRDYAYVSILDVDEFLVPKNPRIGTWKILLQRLSRDRPNSAGFSFHTQIFTLDWGVSNASSDIFVTQYLKRTAAMWDRKKNFFMPSRIQRGSAWTHDYTPLKPYLAQRVSKTDGNIFHYRKCRRHWKAMNTCTEHRRRIYDNTMVTVVNRISDRIRTMTDLLIAKQTSIS